MDLTEEFDYKNNFATEEEYLALQDACVETEEAKFLFRKFLNKYWETKDWIKLLNYKNHKNEIKKRTNNYSAFFEYFMK